MPVAGPGSSQDRSFVTALNEAFAAIAGWSYDHRWWVLAGCAALLAGSLALASRAGIDGSYEAYFDPSDTTYSAYEQYRQDFGSDEVSYILYEAPGFEHGPWNLEVMRRISALTALLESEVPFVYQARSLTNAELVQGTDDGIEIRKLDDAFPETQEALLALRASYLAKPTLVGGLLSPDAEFGAIIVEMDRSSTDPLEQIRLDPEGGDGIENLYPQVTFAALEELLARPEFEGIEFYHSGDVPLNDAYNRIIGDESVVLGLLTLLVISLVFFAFFRSLVSIVAPGLVVQLSVLACVGLVGALGWSLDLSFGSVPTLITAIGVAHSVHILSEFRARFAELGDRREALVQTLYLVGTPCLLTSLTTAAGFASMSFVPIKSIAHMAVYSAFGVMMAFLLSLTLLMALLSFGPRQPRRPASEQDLVRAKGGRAIHAALLAVARFDVRWRRSILACLAGIFVLSGFGIFRVVVDSNWLDDFSDRVPLRGITQRVDDVMGGVSNVIYLFDAGEPDGIKEPAVLREMERVQQLGEAHGGIVRHSYSVVDIIKDLNQAFHADNPDFYTIPETRELVAQYLLLYEMSGGEESEELVSPDYQRASLELRLALASTSEIAALVEAIDAGIDREPLKAADLEFTGIGALWLKLMEHIVTSQIQGVLIALAVITLVMCAALGSLRTGLVAMLPNLSPVLLTLGVMGWAGIPLDYNKLFIAVVAIGIAVDDTLHLVLRYRHEFERTGSYEAALHASMEDVGRALFITSVALVLGFACLTLSVMASQHTFGLLLAGTISVALLADFLLLPALVLTFEPFGPEGQRKRQPQQSLPEAA